MGLFGGDKKTTQTGWSQTTFAPMGNLESLLTGYGTGVAGGLYNELSNLPGYLSFASLGQDPLGFMGGGQGLMSFLSDRSISPEQRANLESVYTGAYDVLGGRQSAAAESARARAQLGVEDTLAAFRDAQGGSGLRGTTAGSAVLGRSLSGLGMGLADLERQFAADRSGLAREGAAGLAGATLDLPFREKSLALSGIDRILASRSQQLQTRGLAQDAQRMLMANPLIANALQERLAGGRTESSMTNKESGGGLGLGGILGMGLNFLSGGLLGGGGQQQAAPQYQPYAGAGAGIGPYNPNMFYAPPNTGGYY